MILNESTRDNLLLPYVQKMSEQGKEISLGQLKTALLRLLADNAGMHNLSLRSNYYLAGAARYYFNGDLTVDGNVGLLTGKPDTFNTQICERLDALINVLRNAYIDTVGSSFEQPEDFGTLTITSLLKKYNSKINKELGIETAKKKEIVDTLDRTPEVGKGYTFEIMYDYPSCRKYERATAPGSWCVTYGEGHFNHYQRNSHPSSHLVIFKQDGWESITRQNGIDKSKWVVDAYNREDSPRPHDPYANSLIAFFQSNESWEAAEYSGAPLITSRWNHGSSDTGRLEADRAYSLEEFMKITGVDQGQLQRIYQIWKKDSVNHKEKHSNSLSPEEKKKQLDFLRKIKYAQMRANGGESLSSVLEGLNVFKFFTNNESLNKGVAACELDNNAFLIDKNQIVFASIVFGQTAEETFISDNTYGTILANSVIVKRVTNGGNRLYSIYNYRFHKIVEVEGLDTFVSFSIGDNGKDSVPVAVEFTQRGKRSILFDVKTGLPIKLPNGRYIYEYSKYRGSGYGVTSNGGAITNQTIMFIMCDESSREAYIYAPAIKKFNLFDTHNFDGITNIKYIWHIYSGNAHSIGIEGDHVEGEGQYQMSQKIVRYFLFDEQGKQLYCFPNNKGYTNFPIFGVYGKYILLRLDSKELRKLGVKRVENKPLTIYNTETETYARDGNGEIIRFCAADKTKCPNDKVLMAIKDWDYRGGERFLVDLDDLTEHHFLPLLQYTKFDYDYNDSTTEYLTFLIRAKWHPVQQERAQETLKAVTDLRNAGYAVNMEGEKHFIFFRYDDILNDRTTTLQNFDAEAVANMINNNEQINNAVNEEHISFNRQDIYEMIKKVCKCIMEIKKRTL